jgi:hypothetical protein
LEQHKGHGYGLSDVPKKSDPAKAMAKRQLLSHGDFENIIDPDVRRAVKKLPLNQQHKFFDVYYQKGNGEMYSYQQATGKRVTDILR